MSKLVPVDPFDGVVFGGTGDLALRKLMPALYHRWRDGQIPVSSRIIGASRQALTTEQYRGLVRDKYREFYQNETMDDRSWTEFLEHVEYCELDAAEAGADWQGLARLIDAAPGKIRLFYFALPPSIYGTVALNIVAAGLKTPETRIVLEKPIGSDLASARAINDAVGAQFDENQVFRIDHYLGKETVQNLLILRFANSLFEPVWNAGAVDHVQISVNESVGAGLRASYYDKSGALRDMVQNHLMQLLCLVAMEPPLDLGADTVRDEKIKVLKALRPYDASTVSKQTVRGQYRAGYADGKPAASYAEELGRASGTETFVALKAHIDNWRWKGVPFFLRTGKRMSARRSEIVIQFKDVAHSVVGPEAGRLQPTRLVIRLQPDEGMQLMLMTKDPGPGGLRLRYVPLNLSYAATFQDRYPDAYERLLMAVVRGDLALFMRRDEVEAAWKWVDGILEAWAVDETETLPYRAGADGPDRSVALLSESQRAWFEPA